MISWTLASLMTLSVAQKDIVDTAVEAGSFKTLVAAVTAADLVGALKGAGPFTVFAPSDEAFAKLPKETLANLLKPENKQQLVDILTYHVVPGKAMAKDVTGLKFAATLNGQRLDFAVQEGKVRVDGALVVAADIGCTNGVIHVIDTVVLPVSENLAGVATKAGTFGTLVAAAKAAGLVPALTGNDALTILAPNDAAFAKLPEGTIASLLEPANKEKLVAILKLHILSGRVYADQALKTGTFATLGSEKVKFEMRKESAFVNASKILATDLEAKNGVIHVIDTVILPSSGT